MTCDGLTGCGRRSQSQAVVSVVDEPLAGCPLCFVRYSLSGLADLSSESELCHSPGPPPDPMTAAKCRPMHAIY